MDPIFYGNIWRMDWGLGNPNKTAALIALLMIVIWVVAFIWKRGFWCVLPIFTILGGCLIHTVSRGGLVAAATGLAIVAWFSPRPWPRQRLIAIVVAVWLMIGFAVFLGAHDRYGKGIVQEDRSITSRFDLWKSAPAMMVAAPGGWGFGNAARAYSSWYQSLERNQEYSSLVNSHLTWMVELSWLGRFGYVAAWCSVILLSWPPRRPHWLSVMLGVWVAFGVASIFSSVAESPWLWIVPGICLVATLISRIVSRNWPARWGWSIPPITATVVCTGLWIAGAGDGGVRHSDNMTIFGKGAPSICARASQ